ncbi:MAG: antitoxin component YwqK of YwqJK toxin-antitoxin module [Bacteroidia bacterium]|jgi:antitoxin component YwqK of YwqJK toxin-antitoxin module
MPRTTLFLFATLWCTVGFGQLKITTTQFQGETYNVYPIRIPLNPSQMTYETIEEVDDYQFGYRHYNRVNRKKGYWNSYGKELHLAFNPFKLKNGKYLVYYEKADGKWDEQRHKYIQTHSDTTTVAITFSIKNNKRSGQVNWYDISNGFPLLQTGYFKDDVKTGTWSIYRKKSKHIYHYENGVDHGKYQVYDNGGLIKEYEYVNGKLEGTYITYRNSKSGKINEQEWYKNGHLLESKAFDKKGRLREWDNDGSTDSIESRSYNKGKLTYYITKKDSLGCSVRKSFTKKGVVTETRYAYNHHDDSLRIYDAVWYRSVQFFLDVLASSSTIAKETYYKNGQLKIKYDVRTDDLTKPIVLYDKKGRVTREYMMNPLDSSLTNIKYFNVKTGQNNSTAVTGNSSNQRVYWLKLDKHNDTSVLKIKPYYLSISHPNETGFKTCYIRKYKTGRYEKYNLLHSTIGVDAKTINDHPVMTLSFKYDGDSAVTVVQTEHDNENILEVKHTNTYPVFKRDPSFMFYHQIQTTVDKISPKNILTLYDTLDYNIKLLDKPFSGELSVKRKYKGKGERYKVKLIRDKTKIHGITYYDTSIRLISYVRNSVNGSNSMNVIFGQPTRIHTGWSKEAHYMDNKKEGEGSDNHGYTGFYIKGQRHGVYKNYNHISEYYKGEKHGLDIKLGYYTENGRYDYQMDYKANFTRDTLHGLFQSFVAPEVVGQSVVFDKGLPHGTYFRGNLTCPTSVKVQLHQGMLIDTGYYYFKEGILKAKVHYQLRDSVYYRYYGPISDMYTYTTGKSMYQYKSGYNSDESILTQDKIIPFQSYRTADYQYFYKNGVKASQGRIENRQKVGIWQYWGLNGSMYKEISNDSGWYVNPTTRDSLFYYGKVQMWYPNGNKLLSGLIKHNNMRFKCDQEMQVNLETLYYLSFYNEAGEQTIQNGSGAIKEFHNNGETRIIGALKNGKRFGMWKFYDPNGRLEQLGRYNKNAKKEGLWVAGDLEAVPYFENLCMAGAVNAFNYPDVNDVGYVTSKIRITESYFSDGARLNASQMTLIPLY